MTCARCAALIRERDEAREHTVTLLDALRVARANLMAWNAIDTYHSDADRDEMQRLYEQSPEIQIIDAAMTATRRG